MHRLVHPLDTALKNQNRGQGIGFTVFGIVFTQRILHVAIIGLWAFAIGILPGELRSAACTTDTTVCRDLGHDCCANIYEGEPASCRTGFVPSQQPIDYLDCKNTGVPNYECCPGGPGDTCASLASSGPQARGFF